MVWICVAVYMYGNTFKGMYKTKQQQVDVAPVNEQNSRNKLKYNVYTVIYINKDSYLYRITCRGLHCLGLHRYCLDIMKVGRANSTIHNIGPSRTRLCNTLTSSFLLWMLIQEKKMLHRTSGKKWVNDGKCSNIFGNAAWKSFERFLFNNLSNVRIYILSGNQIKPYDQWGDFVKFADTPSS